MDSSPAEENEEPVRQGQFDDHAAFDSLVRLHRRELAAFLYRLVACREDAEDLTQETLLRAYQRMVTFQGRSSVRTWLFTIATNLARDHYRSKRRWEPDAQEKGSALARSSLDLQRQGLELHRSGDHTAYEITEHIDFCFTCIMKTLPLEQHLALMLCDIYGFINKEAADILGVSFGVVKHLLHDARTTMQRIFERRCALINKDGVCYQCSELNGFFNGQGIERQDLVEISLTQADGAADLLALRTELIRGIDPLGASGTDLHEFLMRIVRRGAGEDS